jgi:hypothetical protein
MNAAEPGARDPGFFTSALSLTEPAGPGPIYVVGINRAAF